MFSKLHSRLKPYKAGEQPQDKRYTKLNTNENPFTPNVATINAAFLARNLNLYPDPECTTLREHIAKAHNVDTNCVFVGNGSDEVLSFCFGAFFCREGEGKVLFPDVTYSFYKVYCDFYDIPYCEVPLDSEFRINLSEYKDMQGVVIANPNAPTGILLDTERIRDFARENQEKTILVDEAYADFAGVSMLDFSLPKNVIVVKTFSKSFSLAGIRVGYAIGNTQQISALNALKNSFNSYSVNSISQQIATAALEQAEYYLANIVNIKSERDRLSNELEKLGYPSLPSKANFIFTKVKDGKLVYEKLKREGILVRYFEGDRTKEYLRITVGTQDENNKIINAMSNMPK